MTRKIAMVSSTTRDLPRHRESVREACLKCSAFPLMMEHLPANYADAIAISHGLVDRADIYLGVFAWRYGHIPEGSSISITEMEFDRALARGTPILVFVPHKDHAITFDMVEADTDAQKKLASLKQRACKGRFRREFRSPEELECEVIRALTELREKEAEAARTASGDCYPFELLARECRLVRAPGATPDIPFPSWQEYVDERVPKLEADGIVEARLRQHGWASVLDVASVGKTTLALRLANTGDQRGKPAYHFDLASRAAMDEVSDPTGAMRRITKPGTLLILDNVHHHPELARELWEQWRASPNGSRLLLLATDIHRPVVTSPDQDLAFFKNYAGNPSVSLRPRAEDLWRIVQYLHARLAGNHGRSLDVPPPDVLTRWHRNFGGALGAFCVGAIAGMSDFLGGHWDVSQDAISGWVRQKWLKGLSESERENLVCLAAFGAQDLEMQAPGNALPHPGKMENLFARGLVSCTQRGRLNQYLSYALREPGWGRLILATQDPQPDEEAIIFAAALRDASAAWSLCARLWNMSRLEQSTRLWEHLGRHAEEFASKAAKVHLGIWLYLHRVAKMNDPGGLVESLWARWESRPDELTRQALETPLSYVAAFLTTAKTEGHGALAENLWAELEKRTADLARQALEAPLNFVANFLTTARAEGHDALARSLWAELEKRTDDLARQALEGPLNFVVHFLTTARAEGQCDFAKSLWAKLGERTDELAERVLEGPLSFLAGFLATARAEGHSALAESLWSKLEEQPDELARRALEAPVSDLANFLATAHRTVAESIEAILEEHADELASRVLEAPLHGLATFLATAKQGNAAFAEKLWAVLEEHLDELASRTLKAPLDGVANLLLTANDEHSAFAERLWAKLEERVDELASRALEGPLQVLAHFLATARNHEHDALVEKLCERLEAQAPQLAAKAREVDAANLTGFLIRAPESLAKRIIADLTPDDWSPDGDDARPLPGAAALAQCLGELGREDLRDAIAEKLLRRADWRDFAWVDSGMPRVAWLLAHVPPAAKDALPRFLDAICIPHWLYAHFTHGPAGVIASGLRLLAMNQPPAICRRFCHRALGSRLERELSDFRGGNPETRHQAIQMLGASQLVGYAVRRELVLGLPMDLVGQLPLAVLPHQPNAQKVEEWQFQLWLGMRVVASLSLGPVVVSPEAVAETLRLWRQNLADTAGDPASIAHRVHAAMVSWLEQCVAAGGGRLARSRQPLWTLTGRHERATR